MFILRDLLTPLQVLFPTSRDNGILLPKTNPNQAGCAKPLI
jgi:hypothetical protein